MPKQKLENENAFKHLFNRALLQRLSESLRRAYPAFDAKAFMALEKQLAPLEMKARVNLLRDGLKKLLPPAYPAALKILRASLHDGTLKGFDLWPYSAFIEAYGSEHVKISLEALAAMTPIFTAEFAVRIFLQAHPKETLAFLRRCAGSESEDLRRWASEGTRPRLPWGMRLQGFIEAPEATREILEVLKYDAALYVRKSVANHLNDIAKDHPAHVFKTLTAWKKAAQGTGHEKKIEWITRHALRSLIKAGDPAALELIGVRHGADVALDGLAITPRKVKLGGDFCFEFTLRSRAGQPQKIVVDYIVHFVKARRGTAAKVFKLKTLDLAPGAAQTIRKKHAVKKITTRDYYPGRHALEIQVNGVIMGRVDWELTV